MGLLSYSLIIPSILKLLKADQDKIYGDFDFNILVERSHPWFDRALKGDFWSYQDQDASFPHMLLQMPYGVHQCNVQSVAKIQSISGCISVPLYCVRINFTSSGASARESESASVAKKWFTCSRQRLYPTCRFTFFPHHPLYLMAVPRRCHSCSFLAVTT